MIEEAVTRGPVGPWAHVVTDEVCADLGLPEDDRLHETVAYLVGNLDAALGLDEPALLTDQLRWQAARLALVSPEIDLVHKVTIVPRGRSLGATQTLPSEDRMSISEPELRDHLAVLLAGRAAEKLVYNETTVGAENDLERATAMARRMVMNWGMSDRLGPVSYKISDEDPFLGREMHQQRQFSEHTM